MEKIKLTVQIVDQGNEVRLTEHRNVAPSKAKEAAAEIAARMVKYYRGQIQGKDDDAKHSGQSEG